MIEVSDVQFGYAGGSFVLDVPELRAGRGEKIALIGPSGSGKTTLAFLIAGILRPRRGRIVTGGVDLTRASDAERRDFRIARIGFVFQEFELLEYLSVRENILAPYYVNASMRLTDEARLGADKLAESMGLGDKLRRRPGTLSQGEKQRAAICRALATSPELLIADEPTGNLDPQTAETIMDLLIGEVERRQATLLMVTHNHSLLGRFDRVVDVLALAGEGAR